MLDNIVNQPRSLRLVVAHHQGEDWEAVNAAANVLRETRGRIIFTGMGASYFAALPAVNSLRKTGHAVEVIESSELLHYGAGALKAADVGVLISRSGGSAEVVRLDETMRAVGMTTIAVTNVAASPLQQSASLSLQIGSLPDQIIAVQTYTGTVLKLLLLAEEVACGSSRALAEACLTALPALASSIEECINAPASWKSFFTVGTAPLYLIGRGPALAAAYEGGLLFHETAKTTAVGISSGQFRHGPVEVVTKEFHAIVFGGSAETLALDWTLFQDLKRMGADVRWVGSAVAQTDRLGDLVQWPTIEASLAPILEVIPLQVGAYCTALERGIVPGDFRYASEITGTESGFPLLESRLMPT